ncbi:hypothetical protein [Streptomyces sp. CA-253872]|uniref:hypothetical protein n=1 Tax=Streptomyces sp. CA-253872 TaxID=3240067 RepID=UPI003D92671C
MEQPTPDSARGLVQLEGYLLWNAEVAEARRRARCFTEQLPWLTTAQREDIERAYTADRLDDSKEMLRRVAARSVSLRAEYTARYERLRRRCVATAVLGMAAAVVSLLCGVLAVLAGD